MLCVMLKNKKEKHFLFVIFFFILFLKLFVFFFKVYDVQGRKIITEEWGKGRGGLMVLTNQTASGVEEIDGGRTIGDHEGLETQTTEELGLHLGTSLGDLHDGLLANSLDDGSELLSLNFSQLLSLGQLQLNHGSCSNSAAALILVD
jgi:hypothetical protein